MSLPDCSYRFRAALPSGRVIYRCEIGLNFSSVGADAVLCYTCAVPALSQDIDCQRLDVYTSLRPRGGGEWGVEPLLYCEQVQLRCDEGVCDACPLRLSLLSVPAEAASDFSEV